MIKGDVTQVNINAPSNTTLGNIAIDKVGNLYCQYCSSSASVKIVMYINIAGIYSTLISGTSVTIGNPYDIKIKSDLVLNSSITVDSNSNVYYLCKNNDCKHSVSACSI
jgi:hypothetical protein